MKITMKIPESSHLVVRKDSVLCTRCGRSDPVHAGDGTPLPAFLLGLLGCTKRHPARGECHREEAKPVGAPWRKHG